MPLMHIYSKTWYDRSEVWRIRGSSLVPTLARAKSGRGLMLLASLRPSFWAKLGHPLEL